MIGKVASNSGAQSSALDVRELRRTLGFFASGVAVIAADCDGSVHAMTGNAFSSLSLEPPLVLFCPAKRSKLAAALGGASGFTINVLRADQEALATYFAGAWGEAAPPAFRFVPSRCAPRLEGALATLECQIHQVSEGGDHWVVIGRVVGLHRGIEPHRPLLFFKGQYRHVDESAGTPAPDLTAVREEPAHVYYDHGYA